MRGPIISYALTNLGQEISMKLSSRELNNSDKKFIRETKSRVQSIDRHWERIKGMRIDDRIGKAIYQMAGMVDRGKADEKSTSEMNITMENLRHEIDFYHDQIGEDVQYMKMCLRAIEALIDEGQLGSAAKQIRDALEELITLMPRV